MYSRYLHALVFKPHPMILVLNCVNSSEYAPAVYVICKPHETRRSTTTPSFRGIHI